MKLDEKIDVRPEKLAALLAEIERLGIELELVEERFIHGGGRGGQKINKTASCVQLCYPPLELQVRCQRDRRRSVNRFLALRELVERIAQRIDPQTSRKQHEIEQARRRKARRRRRARTDGDQ